MNIYFDLDSTLVDLESEIFKIFKKHGIFHETLPSWSFDEIPNFIRLEIFRMFEKEKIMCKLKPFRYSKKLIKLLKKAGHNVIIVTARSKKLEKQTKKYVKKLFNVKCIVVGHGEDKTEILKENNCDIWIDDNGPQIESCIEAGIKCIMISNNITQYNWYMRDKVEYHYSITGMYEIKSEYDSFKRK